MKVLLALLVRFQLSLQVPVQSQDACHKHGPPFPGVPPKLSVCNLLDLQGQLTFLRIKLHVHGTTKYPGCRYFTSVRSQKSAPYCVDER
jgi:hypothetical protein